MERRSAADTDCAPASAAMICDAEIKKATAITDKRKNNPVLTWNPFLNPVCSRFTIRCFQCDIR
jgi:hypothetical protein